MRIASIFASAFCLALASCECWDGPARNETPKSFDIQGYIDKELAAGAKEIVIPPGRYKVAPQKREHLSFRDLSDVTVKAEGVEMLCSETTRAVTIKGCKNFVLSGLTIDYDPLPFTQGRIAGISENGKALDIELLKGYPTPSQNELKAQFSYETFAQETNTLRCSTSHSSESIMLPSGAIRIADKAGKLDPAVKVGDIVVFSTQNAPGGSIPHAVACESSKGVKLENVTLYASNCFGFLENSCDGTIYKGCKIERRAPASDIVEREMPRLRSLNADAYHSISAVKGPSYIECSASFQGDDCINIHGHYYMILSASGDELKAISCETPDMKPGEPLEILSFEGLRLPDSVLKSVEKTFERPSEEQRAFIASLGLDRRIKEKLCSDNAKIWSMRIDREDLQVQPYSLVCSAMRTGNGFLVKGCKFGFNRSRGILIKGSDGEISGNRLEGNWMSAILVAPEYWWLESGSSRNLLIKDNEILDCGGIGIAIESAGAKPGVPPCGTHDNISIKGNRIEGGPMPSILVTSTKRLKLEGNSCAPDSNIKLMPWSWAAKALNDRKPEPVMTINCEIPSGN